MKSRTILVRGGVVALVVVLVAGAGMVGSKVRSAAKARREAAKPDLSSASDSEILAIAAQSFGDEYSARQSGTQFHPRIAGRLRSLIGRREELGLTAQDTGDLVRWGGQYTGPETTALSMELLEAPLKPVMSAAEFGLVVACMSGMGNEGATREGLEYLTRMTQEEYWLARNAQPECPECGEGTRTAADVRKRLRIAAFHYVYFSGTQYALDVLESGEAFPRDVLEPSVLEAALRYCRACLRGRRPEVSAVP